MAPTIYCTVIEAPAMSDDLGSAAGRFADLVPWADPYIAALLEKLRRAERDRAEASDDCDTHGRETDNWDGCDDEVAELPPPLESDNDHDSAWEADWSNRNWPRH
jgi:hypothetical protein